LTSATTTLVFPQVSCIFQPCYFLESRLLQAGYHSKPSSRDNRECGRTANLWRNCEFV